MQRNDGRPASTAVVLKKTEDAKSAPKDENIIWVGLKERSTINEEKLEGGNEVAAAAAIFKAYAISALDPQNQPSHPSTNRMLPAPQFKYHKNYGEASAASRGQTCGHILIVGIRPNPEVMEIDRNKSTITFKKCPNVIDIVCAFGNTALGDKVYAAYFENEKSKLFRDSLNQLSLLISHLKFRFHRYNLPRALVSMVVEYIADFNNAEPTNDLPLYNVVQQLGVVHVLNEFTIYHRAISDIRVARCDDIINGLRNGKSGEVINQYIARLEGKKCPSLATVPFAKEAVTALVFVRQQWFPQSHLTDGVKKTEGMTISAAAAGVSHAAYSAKK